MNRAEPRTSNFLSARSAGLRHGVIPYTSPKHILPFFRILRLRLITFQSLLHFTLLIFLCTSAFAQAPGKSGVSPSVISLPTGPGAIEGLGPSFEPQLNTGTATHSVPIAVPPGVAGHTPEIMLSYNGGSGNGSLGIGWSLDTPAITRQLDKGLPLYTGATEPAATEDTFLFQGEELVPLSDGTYRCENESGFIRFRKIASDPFGTVDAWQADLPDGGRMLFGTSPAERISRPGANPAAFADTYAWHLSTFTDTSGNTITYQYNPFTPESAGVLYLARIEYARFSDTIHHRVDFTYSGSTHYPEQRPDNFSDFTAGFERRTSKLLREITVTTDDNLVRRYRLDYDPNTDLEPPGADNVPLEFSLLHRVTQLDRSGLDNNYLPPLRFAYTRFAAPESAPFLPVSGGQNFLRFGAPLTEVIDINADGLPDFVSSDSAGWFAYLNLGDGRFSDEIPFTATPADGSDQSIGKRLTEPGITLADLDGDGLTDLFQKSATSARILTHRNLNGFREPSTLGPTEVIRWGPEIEFSGDLQTGEFGALDIAHPSLRMLDLNFDKRTDVMRPFDLGGGTGGIEYILNLPSGWKSELVLAPDPRLPEDWSPDEARFDGQNIAVRIAGLADLNGDRLEDWFTLARVGDETWIDYWPNANGGHWAPRRSTARIQTPGVRADEFRLMDVNADGLTDLVLVRHFELTCWINLGGDRWSDPIRRTDAPPYLEGQTVLRQLDVNANGTTDLFWDNSLLDPGNLPPGASAYTYFDFVGELKPNLLVRIDNGIGLRTTLEYKSTTHDYLEALNSGHPWTTKLPFPLLVVGRVMKDIGLDLNGDGQTDHYLTDFTYRDGYYDSFEKEFRGFAFVQQIERGDDYIPETGQTMAAAGNLSGPSLVTRFRYLTGAPDGVDNDDYPAGYTGAKATDEGTGTGGTIVAFTDDHGGREEESLKGLMVLEEKVDPAVLSPSSDPNAEFNACARAAALAALADPTDPRALRCTPDPYVYTRTRTEWSVRRLYRPQGVNNPPGRFADGGAHSPVHALVEKSVSFAFARTTETGIHEANQLLHELLDNDPVPYPVRPPKITRTASDYDDYGNLVFHADYGLVEAGVVTAGDDERISHTTYAIDDTALARWLIRFPAIERVEDENGIFVSETRIYYDGEPLVGLPPGIVGDRGLPARTEQVITEDPDTLPPLDVYDPERIDRPGDPRVPAGTFLVTSRTAHDRHGNPIVLMDPLGVPADVQWRPNPEGHMQPEPRSGNRGHFRILQYDALRHTYPVKETVVTGDGGSDLTMRASYDPRFGVIQSIEDWNGNRTTLHYDSFGRLVSVVRPGDTEDRPTLRYVYKPGDSHRRLVYHYLPDGLLLDGEPQPAPPPVASSIETQAREDRSDSLDYHTFDSIQITSGAGQLLMTLSEAETQGRWLVSRATHYNFRGRASAEYLPYTRNNSHYHTPADVALRHDGTPVTTSDRIDYAYDPVGRAIRLVYPPEVHEGPRSRSLTQHLPLESIEFDPEDATPASLHFDTATAYLHDGLARLVEVWELTWLSDDGESGNELRSWRTRYGYDLNDRVVLIQDAQDNIRWSRFDGLQREIFKNDPDRGSRECTFDAASNLTETLDAKHQRVTFTYDGVNRILSEDYHDEDLPFSAGRSYDPAIPLSSTNRPDVQYQYDAAPGPVPTGLGDETEPAQTRGRLAVVTDLAGELWTSYDSRGRQIWSIRRIPDHGSGSDPEPGLMASYQTQVTYDALDRVVELRYPDGDRIEMGYNSRNLIESISGGAAANAQGRPFIVQELDYIPSGKIRRCVLGNGVVTEQDYDPRLRLSRRASFHNDTPGQRLLDYRYTYDASGNILKIDDARSLSPFSNTQLFTYDDLYRLTSVVFPDDYSTAGNPDPGRIEYRYDRIGNMLGKTSNIPHQEESRSVTQLGDMQYGGEAGPRGRIGRAGSAAGPHALTRTESGQAIDYDANGNVTRINDRTYVWDFRDRLVATEDASVRGEYVYDFNDRRILRRVIPRSSTSGAVKSEWTRYVDRYFEVREGDQPVKYVWLGDQRIAQVTGTLDASSSRVQRIRLHPGWNLVALAVTPSLESEPLGPQTGSVIQQVLRWNPESHDYTALLGSEALKQGDVFWLYAAREDILEIAGDYAEPDTVALPAGTGYSSLGGLEATPLQPGGDSELWDWWFYSATDQHWRSTRVGLGGEALGAFQPPGTVVFWSASTVVDIPVRPPHYRIGYFLVDHLGSVNLLLDAAGAPVRETAYYPFGQVRRSQAYAAGQTVPVSDYAFGSKEWEEEGAHYYFEARHLEPALGRFNRVDPALEGLPASVLLNPQLLHPYSYGQNNPIKYVDRDGASPDASSEGSGAGDVPAALLAPLAQYQPPATAPNQTQPTQSATATKSPYLEGGTLVVSTAAGGIAVPDPSQPPQTLHTYRGDTRSPEVIFKEGFQPRAPHSPVSLYDYARNNTPSAFIGTSKSKTVAKGFAFNPASGQPKKETYIYAVRLSKGVDVNLALGQTSPFPHEREVAVQGGISSSSIKGAWHYRRNSVTGSITRGQFIKNPQFGKGGGK